MQVHVDLAARPRVVLVQERPDVHHAGVVDQHVERAEPLGDRRQEGGERLAARDVERARRARRRPPRRAPASRSPTATRAPRAASARAVARPIPRPPPVTATTRPVSSGTAPDCTFPGAMDWEAEGLLEGVDGRRRARRRAARCSTSCTPTACRSRSCATRSPSSGSRCCRSSGCSAPRPATRRARSPSRPALDLDYFQAAAARARARRARAGRARVRRARPRGGADGPASTAQAGFPDDEAMEVQRVLGRGMARYAEAVTHAGRADAARGRDRRARAGRPAGGRVARSLLPLAGPWLEHVFSLHLREVLRQEVDHRRAARDGPARLRPRQRGRVRRPRRLHRARRDDPGRGARQRRRAARRGWPRRSSSRRPRSSRRSATP